MTAATPIEVQHDEAASRFETHADGWLARCDYRISDGVMLLTHTEVPPALEGRGIAAALVRTALQHARDSGLRVRPMCSYVSVFLRRHVEYQDLMA